MNPFVAGHSYLNILKRINKLITEEKGSSGSVASGASKNRCYMNILRKI